MIEIAKTLGRLIAVLVDIGILKKEYANWIIEPLVDILEDEPRESEDGE